MMALKSMCIIDLAPVSRETKYVELASNPDFDTGFKKALFVAGAKRY
jgi:hypothetical protein